MKEQWNKLVSWNYRTRDYNWFKHLSIGTILTMLFTILGIGAGETYFAVIIIATLWEVYFFVKFKRAIDAWDILASTWTAIILWIMTFL